MKVPDAVIDQIEEDKPGAPTIYAIHPGGNFRCKYSVLQLVETQIEKSEDVLVSIGKFKRKGKNASIKPIAYNF